MALLRNRQSIRNYRRNIRSLKRTLNQEQLASRIVNLLAGTAPSDIHAS